MNYDSSQLRRIVEGALMAAGEPLSLERLATLFDEQACPEKTELTEALLALQSDCHDRGYELVEVASGWRFQVRENLAQWVNRLWDEKPQKYSRALLETLALIAYRQPITRGDIEEVRGVAVSSHIIKTLAEREWIKVVGHRDVPGRPSLYATTRHFLDYFNLKSLDQLPTLNELKDIDGLNQSLGLSEAGEEDLEQDQIAEAGMIESDAEAETEEASSVDTATGDPTPSQSEGVPVGRADYDEPEVQPSNAAKTNEDEASDSGAYHDDALLTDKSGDGAASTTPDEALAPNNRSHHHSDKPPYDQ